MSILNFVTQEELDGLDEDPRKAFMQLVNYAQKSLFNQTSKINPENEYDWNRIEELQQKFMNVIVASGKKYEVEPFASINIPKHSEYRTTDYKQFESDLDHYVTQLIIDNSLRTRKNSVGILQNSKEKIRDYVRALKTCIENAQMEEKKKQTLLDRLEDFEKELEKRRTNVMAVTMLALDILAVPGGAWASVEITQKLITNITQVFADSKSIEDQIKQIEKTTPPKALSPPRKPMEKEKITNDLDSLDDDIPF
jgi:hypothetical protein